MTLMPPCHDTVSECKFVCRSRRLFALLATGRVVFVAITMFQRPEKAAAYAELRRHLLLLGAWVGAVRASTYVLHYLNEK